LKKFSDNSWTSSKEFKEFENGKNGFLVRFDIENGPCTNSKEEHGNHT
jgi:hypothetical protein